ncbi:hypothetical protein CCUS01_09577 [Colletotrichum cuscutae]|uniref:Uncharacterized protein n=1 Tax=Colletotrichum cuscutae TaxID=1209917 RepID=A0AAI9XP23_9PEZI|nr:hypothetical protein CCUS01_09577 [Colletotrichum cuscutae]
MPSLPLLRIISTSRFEKRCFPRLCLRVGRRLDNGEGSSVFDFDKGNELKVYISGLVSPMPHHCGGVGRPTSPREISTDTNRPSS